MQTFFISLRCREWIAINQCPQLYGPQHSSLQLSCRSSVAGLLSNEVLLSNLRTGTCTSASASTPNRKSFSFIVSLFGNCGCHTDFFSTIQS